MHKYIGADITSMVTLPVMIFEPMTMLQKMAEVCISRRSCKHLKYLFGISRFSQFKVPRSGSSSRSKQNLKVSLITISYKVVKDITI